MAGIVRLEESGLADARAHLTSPAAEGGLRYCSSTAVSGSRLVDEALSLVDVVSLTVESALSEQACAAAERLRTVVEEFTQLDARLGGAR